MSFLLRQNWRACIRKPFAFTNVVDYSHPREHLGATVDTATQTLHGFVALPNWRLAE
jgi:hypothetical protein